MGIQATFKALSDPTRREILEMLKGGTMSAGDIAERFDMSQATVSHHLALLREAELVEAEKQGKYIYYMLNMSVMEEIFSWMSGFMEVQRHEDEKSYAVDNGVYAAGGGAGELQPSAGNHSDTLGN